MIRIILLLAVVTTSLAADLSHVDKQFQGDSLTEGVVTHEVFKKQNEPEHDHPVFRGEEKNEGRARVEPVRPRTPYAKHDMLADEPMQALPTEVDKMDAQQPNYGYSHPVEVAFPDVPYAPSYGYGPSYAPPSSYDVYANSPSDYFLEPDTSAFGLLWSQVPDARTMVNYAGRTIGWILNSFIIIIFGSFLTVGFCTYTDLCSIKFNGIGPIHEEMRSLMSPEKLEKIGHAAEFVKSAIDKYQKIQKVHSPNNRLRRAITKN
ncbi:uncharacterized protein LOC121740196 [Aricia agestis]|uniref:uncharacterized protein LOC121740196 n=1 Tax=Aricia agestis TaxID=91739 RepID=UPI001C20B49A|nr:uncharacterized protein LOC121740196 [Aricia agestis]